MTRFPGPMEPGWHHSGWYDVLGWLLPTMFLVALIALGVWAVLRLAGPGRPATPASGYVPKTNRMDPALEQVRLRYARGEMSRDEFLQLTADLGGRSGDPGPPTDTGT